MVKKIYEVLNVGQGDSIIVRPPDGCCYHGETVFVDLGPGGYDITSHIKPEEKVHIFLTHHDNDHLEGLRFFIGKMNQVEEITVPFYQNEITLIARAILNLKGINEADDCEGLIRSLEEIVNNQRMIKALTQKREGQPRLTFAYEGVKIRSQKGNGCKHIECLNPPFFVETYNWLKEMDQDDTSALIYELFDKKFADEMAFFVRSSREGSRAMDSPGLVDYWLWDWQEDARDAIQTKCNYVLDFVMGNASLFRQFNMKGSRKILKKIYRNYVSCTHDVCTVLKLHYQGYPSMLLTGDASKKVFRRLIREGKDISADYLKMPHHGSRKNMDEKILEHIDPATAIISHNNRRFGKAKDSHPHQEVLNLLAAKKINILITNDVIKHGRRIMNKDMHRKDNSVHIW